MLLLKQQFSSTQRRRSLLVTEYYRHRPVLHIAHVCLIAPHLVQANLPALEPNSYNSAHSGYSIATSFVSFLAQCTQGEFYLHTSLFHSRSQRWQIRSPHSLFNLAVVLEILMSSVNWITLETLKYHSAVSHLGPPIIVLANTSSSSQRKPIEIVWRVNVLGPR